MIFFMIIYAVRTVLFHMLSVYKTEHILATIKNECCTVQNNKAAITNYLRYSTLSGKR